jgi:predicted nucleic acid-binding protein
MRTYKLNPPIIFDTDCISSFLWVKRLEIPENLFPKQVKIPHQVVVELDNLKRSSYIWVPILLEEKIRDGTFEILSIPALGLIANDFVALSTRMGSGEAATLSLVKGQGGVVASNNLRDVNDFCEKNKLELIHTDDILCMAVIKGIITETEGQVIWTDMKNTKRKLPSYDFSVAFKLFREGT